MSIEKLEQKGAIQALIYLYKTKEASKTEISRNIKATFDTLKNKALPLLEELGLVKHIEMDEFPRTHIYSLTERGYELAKCISEIINM